ncbi:hypothetical protein [Pararhizobium sp. PWRC1-1]|uniref:hypothetical protein n=1 Tax=Pararhizobium sp. PWRC1-1 TaxID=2804566 RepID=UPI003CFB2088
MPRRRHQRLFPRFLGQRQTSNRSPSLGIGDETLKLREKHLNGGVTGWGISIGVPPLFKIAARAQSKNALGQAHLLVGKNNVVRVDVPEHDQLIALDDVRRSLIELPRVARAQADASGHYIESVFLADNRGYFCDGVKGLEVKERKHSALKQVPSNLAHLKSWQSSASRQALDPYVLA